MTSTPARPKHRLGVLDRAFFLLESAEATCHVGLLGIFAPPSDAGPDFVRELVAGMREQRDVAAPFTYRLAQNRPRALAGPWVELSSEDVDLDYHFRHSALPHPGSQRDLGILISRLHSRPLDPSRPLWEQHVIEGLADGRFALYLKVHHALMDGVTGTSTFARSLSTDSQSTGARPIWTVPRPSRDAAAPGGALQSPHALTRAVSTAKVAAAVGSSLIGGTFTMRRLRDDDHALPFLGPVSPTLNGRVSRQRRVVTQTYELGRLKTVAATHAVSTNDVFLAVCAGALRRYLEHIGEPHVRSLTASVPVSLRDAHDSSSGNAVGMLAAKLHTDVSDPLQRLHAISRSTSLAKEGLRRLPPAARSHQTALATSPLMVQSLVGLAGRGGRPHANLVLSNVAGPSAQHYLGGATLQEAYPLSMLMHGQTLNITAFSTGGRLNIGIVGCRDQLPHLQKMATYLAESLRELENATAIGA